MRLKLPHWLRRYGAAAVAIAGALAVVVSLVGFGRQAVGSVCRDGFPSESVGQGTCSSHGGVDSVVEVNTLLGQQPGNWIWIVKWPLLIAGIGLAGAGTVGHRRVRRNRVSSDQAHEYLEMTVTLELTENGYEVEVCSPTGASARRQRSELLPLDRGMQELERLRGEINGRRVGSRRAGAIEKFGIQLFEILFDASLEKIFRQSIDHVREQGCALRVVLQVDDSVVDVPWEYLFDRERASFLALSPETSIVRLANTVHATRPHAPIDVLRVLVMGASPTGTANLDLEAEHRSIETQLRTSALRHAVQLNFVNGGTLAALHKALEEFEPHIFHFTGHGKWDDDLDDGVVLFEARGRRQQAVTGRNLGVLLNRSSMRLAIFNSCDGGRVSKSDRFAGIAPSLVAQGVPAAIGMQFRFDDQAASTFGSTLLKELAQGNSIDDALTTARTAVFSIPNDVEWATPVFTSRDGVDRILPRASGRHVPARSEIARDRQA